MIEIDPTAVERKRIRDVLLSKREAIEAQLQKLTMFTIEEPCEETVASFRCKLSNIALINQLLIDIGNLKKCSN